MLDPEENASQDERQDPGIETSEPAPVANARPEERRFVPRPAAPASADNPFRRPSAAAVRQAAPAAGSAKIVTTDYGYVVAEVTRILITSAAIIVLLIVIAFLKG